MGRNRNRNRNRKNNNGMGVISRFGSKVPFKPKPVTRFDRPVGESFSVSGVTGFPSVFISGTAHGKMLALVKECDIEIGWMCTVEKDEDGDFHLNDVYVPLQTCTASTTVISERGDSELMMELLEQGKGAEVNALRCWGHSHVNMAVFASQTDETQTQDFIDNLEEAGSDHFIRLIGNKRGELLCHVYLMEQGITLNNPPMTVRVDGKDYSDWAKEQIATKVTRAAPVHSYRPHIWTGGQGSYVPPYAQAEQFNPMDYEVFDPAEAPPLQDEPVPLSSYLPDERSALFDDIKDDPYGDFGLPSRYGPDF